MSVRGPTRRHPRAFPASGLLSPRLILQPMEQGWVLVPDPGPPAGPVWLRENMPLTQGQKQLWVRNFSLHPCSDGIDGKTLINELFIHLAAFGQKEISSS